MDSRKQALIVGICDLILKGSTALVLIASFLSIFLGIQLIDNVVDLRKNENTGIFGVLVILLFALLLVGLQIFSAVQLIKSTSVNLSLLVANQKVQLWRIVTLVLTILVVGGSLADGEWVGAVVFLVISCVFLYVVQKFKNELDFAIANPHATTRKDTSNV